MWTLQTETSRFFPSKHITHQFHQTSLSSEISGSDGGEYEDGNLLGYGAVKSR
jgi:hypothetical protein